MSELENLGACPTGEHVSHPQCGYIGCVDLRPWAKANHYRYRLDESYEAEDNAHVKGDGRWFVEVLCQGGFILLAVAKAGVCKSLESISGVILRRIDTKSREFEFPLDKLDQVAAILK